MTRTIKFRGFHPCDGDTTICVGGKEVRGRWVYGSLITNPDGFAFIGFPLMRG